MESVCDESFEGGTLGAICGGKYFPLLLLLFVGL